MIYEVSHYFRMNSIKFGPNICRYSKELSILIISIPVNSTDTIMDMPTAASAMADMTMATTASSTSAASTAAMDTHMDMGGGCKINMLWNWYTIDACE